MAGAHRDVGNAEVEELARGFLVAKPIEAYQVLLESGLQGMIKEMLHGEVFREEGTRGFPGPRSIMEIRSALLYDYIVLRSSRSVYSLLGLGREVDRKSTRLNSSHLGI